mgnify:CR=1 FL=1
MSCFQPRMTTLSFSMTIAHQHSLTSHQTKLKRSFSTVTVTYKKAYSMDCPKTTVQYTVGIPNFAKHKSRFYSFTVSQRPLSPERFIASLSSISYKPSLNVAYIVLHTF